ncbi:MAG: deoxyribose-phosphate aldolase [Lishizhenia sp.]
MKLQTLFSCVDLTSLSLFDNEETILKLIEQAQQLEQKNYPVASICTYPKYAPLVSKTLQHSNIKTCVVNSSFPHGQASLASKLSEINELKPFVDEIDIVIDLGNFIREKPLIDLQIKAIKNALGNKVLKVILETGEIKEEKLLREICKCAMYSGADFIKTSTGKTQTGATPNAVRVMAEEIAAFKNKEQKKVGLKISGGIRTLDSVNHFTSIIQEYLPESYFTKQTFRIGASSLLNELKKDI